MHSLEISKTCFRFLFLKTYALSAVISKDYKPNSVAQPAGGRDRLLPRTKKMVEKGEKSCKIDHF